MTGKLEKIGKYLITKKLMTTGFSDIYIARDPDLKIDLAIKVFHLKEDNIGSKAEYDEDYWRNAFIEEARLLARLDHPNIVTVRDFGWLADTQPFFVMPFITANLIYEMGKDAANEEDAKEIDYKWRPRALDTSRAMEILGQILAALSVLHRRKIIYRDLKPGNILLTEKSGGSVKLCDFGMVKMSGVKDGERSGVWIGTADYMSPEQLKSARDVDARADIYSAGLIAHRMLTGWLPDRTRAQLDAATYNLPHKLVDFINACISSNIHDRPNDAAQALSRLRRIRDAAA